MVQINQSETQNSYSVWNLNNKSIFNLLCYLSKQFKFKWSFCQTFRRNQWNTIHGLSSCVSIAKCLTDHIGLNCQSLHGIHFFLWQVVQWVSVCCVNYKSTFWGASAITKGRPSNQWPSFRNLNVSFQVICFDLFAKFWSTIQVSLTQCSS